jgi:GTPase
LGVVQIDNDRTMVVADIPGLIPGAAEGVGLGVQFLRHIERTNLFVHLIDASGASGRDPLQDYHDINHELKEYDKSKAAGEGFRPLGNREQIVALNKIDVLRPEEVEEMKNRFKKAGIDVRAISAVAGIGVRELIFEAGRKVLGT